MSASLELASGLAVEDPLNRLRRFCSEEYDVYDAVSSIDPNHVDPSDVAITIALNSFVNTAPRLRTVQRGLASSCDPILARIPDAALLESKDPPLDLLHDLLRTAVGVRWVLVPVATKVLHRKRRGLIPILDQVVLDYYLDAAGREDLKPSTQDKQRAADTAMIVIDTLRHDLLTAHNELLKLREVLAEEECRLTMVRILDILVWTEVEPRGYYRSPAR